MNSLQDFEKTTYKEWVEQSGIDPELFDLNVRCEADEVAGYGGDVSRPLHDALNWDSNRWDLKGKDRNYGAIITNADGSVFQVKLSNPRQRDGKVVKYETPLKQQTKPFFAKVSQHVWKKVAKHHGVEMPALPCDFWSWVKATNIPIVWTEGAKKALSLLSHGYAAIALSGVSNGYRTPKDELGKRSGKSYLVPEVAEFVNGDHIHFICFDSDSKPKTINRVNAAIGSFGRLIEAKANELKAQAARVKVLQWEPSLGKGCDDLIVASGIQTFEEIVKNAKYLARWQIELDRKLTFSPDLAVIRRYLGDLDLPKRASLACIKSAMGTGKTQSIFAAFGDCIGDPDYVVFAITHRDNLAAELSRRGGIVHRKEISLDNS